MRLGWAVFLAGCLALAASPARGQAPSAPMPVFDALARIAADRAAPTEERLSAIQGLGQAAHPRTTAPLLALLPDPDSRIRAAVAVALGWLGNDPAVEPLLDRATDATEALEVRRAAIGALGKIGDARAVAPVEALARSPVVGIRRETLLALSEGALGARTDRGAAAITLLTDVEQDGYSRALAAAVLGAIRDPRAVAPLIRVLEDRRPPAGFAELPSPDGLTGQARTFAERLRSLHNVRARAARALADLQAHAAEPVLLDTLSDPDRLVRIQSAAALGFLHATSAVPKLIQTLADPDVLVRETAASALGAIGDPAAGPTLLPLLTDAEPALRARAAGALGQLRYEPARAALTRLAEEDEVPAVRATATEALRELGDEEDDGSDD